MPDVITVLENNVVTTQVAGSDVLLPMAIAAASVQADRAETAAAAAEGFLDDALAIQALGDDAAAIAARAAKAANLSDLADPSAATGNLLFENAGTGAQGISLLNYLKLNPLRPESYRAPGDPDFTLAMGRLYNELLVQGGGDIRVGRDLYDMTELLDISPGYSTTINIVGEGQESIISQTAAGVDAIRLGHSAYLRGSGIHDITVINTATGGHLIMVGANGVTGFESRNVQFTQNNPAKSILTNGADGGGMYDSRWNMGDWNMHPSASAVSPVKWVAQDTTFNENTFQNLRLYNANGAPFWDISNDDLTTWMVNNTFRNINFEICAAGGFKIANARGWKLVNCSFWDVGGPYTGHLIHLADNGGYESIGNTIDTCQRHGDSLSAGKHDIYLEAAEDTIVSQCYVPSPDGPSYDWNSKRVTVNGTLFNMTNAGAMVQIEASGSIFPSLYFGGGGAASLSVSGGNLEVKGEAVNTGVLLTAKSSGGTERKLYYASDGSLFAPLAPCDLGATGLEWKDGYFTGVLKVDGLQVVGPRITGEPGAASDPASTMALANWLRTVVLSHGLGGT